MLAAAGATCAPRGRARVSIEPAERLELDEVTIPGDFSAAAPFIVAATLLPGSELTIHDVGLNPRRTGLLDVLERMGARITLFNRRKRRRRADRRHRGALVAELTATRHRRRRGAARSSTSCRSFALAAALARGDSRVDGAGGAAR